MPAGVVAESEAHGQADAPATSEAQNAESEEARLSGTTARDSEDIMRGGDTSAFEEAARATAALGQDDH